MKGDGEGESRPPTYVRILFSAAVVKTFLHCSGRRARYLLPHDPMPPPPMTPHLRPPHICCSHVTTRVSGAGVTRAAREQARLSQIAGKKVKSTNYKNPANLSQHDLRMRGLGGNEDAVCCALPSWVRRGATETGGERHPPSCSSYSFSQRPMSAAWLPGPQVCSTLLKHRNNFLSTRT